MTKVDLATCFPAPYVRKLRSECCWRRRQYRAASAAAERAMQEAQRAKDEAAAAGKAADEAAAARIAEAAAAADQRVIRAELKAAAMRAGMLDLDGLKLLDTTVVTLNGDGEVVIPEDFFEDAKAAKPYLFGTSRIG